ncbi:MAG: hypothetical protein HYR55_05895 [Acidobacteria bacterium]|nr:hypothetical protein [Acidobacteriota bacterium]MBI3654897.1 hypothetical protein [Acidobacteriota bacterium]
MGLRTVEFSREDRVKFIGLSDAERWSWHYLGKNKFVLIDKQIEKIKAKDIPFTEVANPPQLPETLLSRY